MVDLITFNATVDLSSLYFSAMMCGFTLGCITALFGWMIGWGLNLLSKAF